MPSTLTARTILVPFLVLSLVTANRGIPVCDENLYGHPKELDCRIRLRALQFDTDRKDHFFGLRSVPRRPQSSNLEDHVTMNQWRNWEFLPFITSKVHGASQCILGVFPIELPDHTLSWDTSHYRSLAIEGNTLLQTCRESGGRVLAGNEERLAVILYEPGSTWDRQVQTAEARRQAIYVPLGSSLAAPPAAPPAAPAPTYTATPGGHGDQWGMSYGDQGAGPSNWQGTGQGADRE
ncbi:hypothetical protein MMC13_001060 [Lambiella insularis]|nr:hypothetical protein [Lambiella insularis]